jgi:hypothetical protein
MLGLAATSLVGLFSVVCDARRDIALIDGHRKVAAKDDHTTHYTLPRNELSALSIRVAIMPGHRAIIAEASK